MKYIQAATFWLQVLVLMVVVHLFFAISIRSEIVGFSQTLALVEERIGMKNMPQGPPQAEQQPQQ